MSVDLTTTSKLLEEDRLRMRLSDETNARLTFERQNMNYQIAQLSARAKKHAEEKLALGTAIAQKYGLKEQDSVDPETGEIVRVPIATKPPELPPPPASSVPQPDASLPPPPHEPVADPHPNGATAPATPA